MNELTKEELFRKMFGIAYSEIDRIPIEWLNKFSDEYAKQECFAFKIWCEMNNYRIKGWDDSQLEKIYDLFLQSKLTENKNDNSSIA